MEARRVELPEFEKFTVSFEKVNEAQKIEESKVEHVGARQTKRASHLTLTIPDNWQETLPWPEIPSPSIESFKETEPVTRPPLHKDRKRLIVFIGLMLAWLFVCDSTQGH
jgi:hypothetical protein